MGGEADLKDDSDTFHSFLIKDSAASDLRAIKLCSQVQKRGGEARIGGVTDASHEGGHDGGRGGVREAVRGLAPLLR